MYQKRHVGLAVIVAVLLSYCELLSANGGQKKKEESKKSRPELVWQSGTVSRSEVPPPVIEDSSVYVVNGYALAKLNLNNGENHWVTELEGVAPDIYGDILVDDQSIYLRFGESLKRYDKSDGALQWSVAFEDSIDRFKLPLATSLVSQSQEHVFVGTRKNVLVVNKQQGKVSRTIAPEVPVNEISDQRLNMALGSDLADRVYVLTSYRRQESTVRGKLSAYDYTDGSLLWEFEVPYELAGLPEISLPTMQMANTSAFLLLMTGPAVLAVDAETGELAWEHLFYKNRTDINIGGLLFKHNNNLYASEGNRILKLDFQGQRKWETTIVSGFIENLFVVEDQAYFATGILPGDTAIHSIDIESGELIFSFAAQESGLFEGFTSSFDANGTFIVNMGSRSIYGYKLTQ